MVPAAIDPNNVFAISSGAELTVNMRITWDIPFDNFDPIQYYNITVTNCRALRCPLVDISDNTTTSRSIRYYTFQYNVTVLVTASNSIGSSDPAIFEITGMLQKFVCISVVSYLYQSSCHTGCCLSKRLG